MIVVGFDPGTRKTGWAVLKIENQKVEVLEFGAWKLNADTDDLGERLENLYQHSKTLLSKWNPRWVGLEWAVSHKNVVSSLKLSEARGVIRLALQQTLDQAGKRLIEISPTEVKKKMSGLGQAQKNTVEKILQLRMGSTLPVNQDHDAYDAIGIAWTAWIKSKVANRLLQARPPIRTRATERES